MPRRRRRRGTRRAASTRRRSAAARAAAAGQRASRRHPRGDVCIGVQEGRGPVVGAGEETLGWDLRGGVECLEIAGKSPQHPEPPGYIDGAGMGWLAAPGEGKVGGDPGCAGLIGEGDEAGEKPAFPHQLEAEATAYREVLLEAAG